MLLYLTIAPRKLTVNPIVIRKEKEKKIQNQIKCFECTPFVLQKINNRNRKSKNAVSVAAAIESICLTSPGCGLNVVDARALGVLTTKLVIEGSRSLISIPEFP